MINNILRLLGIRPLGYKLPAIPQTPSLVLAESIKGQSTGGKVKSSVYRPKSARSKKK